MDKEGWALFSGVVGTGVGILVGARLKFFYDSRLRREADRRAHAERLFIAFSDLKDSVLEDFAWEHEALGEYEFSSLWQACRSASAQKASARMLGANFYADYGYAMKQSFDFVRRMTDALRPVYELTEEEKELQKEQEEWNAMYPDSDDEAFQPFTYKAERARTLEGVERCLAQLRDVLAL